MHECRLEYVNVQAGMENPSEAVAAEPMAEPAATNGNGKVCLTVIRCFVKLDLSI